MQVLWAEDGGVFLQDANWFGLSASLWRPYSGYQHFIPRVIAAAVAELPVDRYAVAMNLLSCLVVGIVAALTFELSKHVTSHPVVRGTLASAVVLLPAAPIEVLGNVANLHSYCLWLIPWILLARPTGPAGSAGLGAISLVAALTEIQTIIFAPFFLLRARNPAEWPKLGGIGAGLLVQLGTALIAPRPASGLGVPTLASVTKGYVVNGFMSLFVPQGTSAGAVLATAGWTSMTAALVLVLTFVIWALWMAAPVPRKAIGLLVYGSICTFVLGYSLLPIPDYGRLGWQDLLEMALLRYGFISSLFLAGAVILACGECLAAGHKLRGALILIAVWTSFVFNFRQSWTWRSGGSVWSASLDASYQWCREQGEGARRTVPLWPPGFAIQLSCEKIKQHSRT